MGTEPRGALSDAAARRRAATEFTCNLVVRAGAGTGKTSLVVERVLTAIGADVARMDAIAAITFTEKAAGELQQRLALGLDRLRALACGEAERDPVREADRAFAYLTGEGGIPSARIGERTLAAMELLDRGTVSTIHGFCSELLRQHPLEAGVDPDFVVDSGERAEALLRRVWDEFVADELGPRAVGTPRAESWRRLLDRLSISRIQRVAHLLADFHVPDALLAGERPIDPARLFADDVAAARAEIDDLLERQTGMTPLAESCFRYVGGALAALAEQGVEAFHRVWAADPGMVNRLEDGGPKPNTKLRGVSPARMKGVMKQGLGLVKALRAVDEELALLLVRVVAPFARRFRERYLREGAVSFDGLLVLARDLLRDHPEVRRTLKRRIRLLLVDEFQDTDPLQYEIVLFLAERAEEAAADPYAAALEPGRLFVVGDAKQSIYRFRGADYAADRRATERIVEAGGEVLSLTGNFRSVPGILEPVNRLFASGGEAWTASPYQPDYVPIEPVRAQADASPRVEVWTVSPADTLGATERRIAEGRAVATEISRLVEEERSCRYSQITILFRAFTHITHYLRPLRERGIPFVVDGGKEFLDRPEVGQLLATLRALAQPSDPAALLAYLRSPAGAASDIELAHYASAGHVFAWRERADPAQFPHVARCFEALRVLADETRYLPADAVVRHVLDRALLLPLGAAAFEGPQRVANLTKLAAAAGELARDGKLSLEEVVEALEEGRLEDLKSDRPLADDAAEAVRITSIHRMKGLENDRVFVPDLARADWWGRTVEEFGGVTRLDDGSLALAIKADKRAANLAHAWHELQEARHGTAEEQRVLYVALTRARERLVVLGGRPGRGSSSWVKALAAWGYDGEAPPEDGATLGDGRVLHRVPSPDRERASLTTVPERIADDAVRRYERALAAAVAGARPPFAAPSGLEPERATGADAARGEPLSRSRDTGKAIGIVLHRLLETWEGEDDVQTRARLACLSREVGESTETDPEQVGREAGEILDRFFASGLAARLRGLEVLGRELPLLALQEGTAYRGSIDLVYREAGGAVVVADYKTDLEADAALLAERYGRQLGVYAEAVRSALGLLWPPRRELWLLRGGTIVELP